MYSFLTEEQNRWIEMQKMILKAKPDFTKFFVPKSPFKLRLYIAVNSNTFDIVIMACILLNIISMGMTYEEQGQTYTTVLEAINYFFSSIFFIECVLKVTAMGFKGYCMSYWNIFDLFVVASSVIDILLSLTTG